jgi:hypothetical protein
VQCLWESVLASSEPNFLTVADYVVTSISIRAVNSIDDEDRARHWSRVGFGCRYHVTFSQTGLFVLKVVNKESVGLLVFEHHTATAAQQPVGREGPWDTLVAVLLEVEGLAKVV